MRFRFRNKAAAAGDGSRPASSPPNAGKFAAPVAGGGGAADVAGESPDQDSTRNGSKDESFFEARPWLDSDSEDDFHSVRGDFTPSRGTTPDHQRQSPFAGRISVDRSEPSLIEKKQRLLELLQEKQQYDDDSVADVGSEIENGAVHAEEYLKSSRKGAKANRASKSRGGCFPSSFWKIKFRSCRKKRKEQND
ncbi:uncharacterized protein At3g27210 [Oryza sativa Japonica Group]|nr:hypothetical protein OsI_15605 [Oryza sativa Indica Group]EAZ30475.1 hypothetical protein OsJ_14520 [Oryza sativa Japonica Group]BAS88886.1 Os04g0380200 [Oryza sativa Japonica Group]CAE03997.1 OSJNBb0089B03.11 [Oryza sativa Japonica Group]